MIQPGLVGGACNNDHVIQPLHGSSEVCFTCGANGERSQGARESTHFVLVSLFASFAMSGVEVVPAIRHFSRIISYTKPYTSYAKPMRTNLVLLLFHRLTNEIIATTASERKTVANSGAGKSMHRYINSYVSNYC